MSYESVVLADSPTLLWLLQETSGTAAADATGNGHAGTYAGATLAQPGPLGVGNATAASFAGAYTSMVYSNSAVSLSGAFSLEFWFNTSSATAQGLGGNSADIYAANAETQWVYLDAAGDLIYGMYGTNAAVGTAESSGKNYATGTWHYVAATSDTSGNMVLYADGASIATAAEGSAQYADTLYFLAAGEYAYALSSAEYLLGAMAAYAVYPVALSAAQVGNHFNASGYGSAPSAPLPAPPAAAAGSADAPADDHRDRLCRRRGGRAGWPSRLPCGPRARPAGLVHPRQPWRQHRGAGAPAGPARRHPGAGCPAWPHVAPPVPAPAAGCAGASGRAGYHHSHHLDRGRWIYHRGSNAGRRNAHDRSRGGRGIRRGHGDLRCRISRCRGCHCRNRPGRASYRRWRGVGRGRCHPGRTCQRCGHWRCH